MNYQEIIDELENQDISVNAFAYGDIPQPLPNIGKWEEIYQEGGEGQGETWYSVMFFTEHDIYIRVDGFYTSYNGTDFYDGWGCAKEVRPQEKTITVYE